MKERLPVLHKKPSWSWDKAQIVLFVEKELIFCQLEPQQTGGFKITKCVWKQEENSCIDAATFPADLRRLKRGCPVSNAIARRRRSN